MEAPHKTHRPHIKVGNGAVEEEDSNRRKDVPLVTEFVGDRKGQISQRKS